MVTLAIVSAMLSVSLAFWLLHAWFIRLWTRYRQVYTHEASTKLSEVFLFIDPQQLWFINLIFCLASSVLVQALTTSFIFAVIVGLIGIRLPHRLIKRLQQQRLARFDHQLPDALLALGSALKSGVSLINALRHLIDQAQAPLSQEFGLMLREQRLGVTFDQSLIRLRYRMPSDTTGLVIAVMRIATQTGGNLSEALERIAYTLRAQLQLEAKIKTLTAQGRMQAWVIGSLPPLLAIVLNQLDPQAMAALWHTPTGWAVLTLISVLEASGILMIRRIVNINI